MAKNKGNRSRGKAKGQWDEYLKFVNRDVTPAVANKGFFMRMADFDTDLDAIATEGESFKIKDITCSVRMFGETTFSVVPLILQADYSQVYTNLDDLDHNLVRELCDEGVTDIYAYEKLQNTKFSRYAGDPAYNVCEFKIRIPRKYIETMIQNVNQINETQLFLVLVGRYNTAAQIYITNDISYEYTTQPQKIRIGG